MGVLTLIRSNPNKLRHLFVTGRVVPLTADKMIDMFITKYSPEALEGSNQREIEDNVILRWCHYLQLIEGTAICNVYNLIMLTLQIMME